MRPIEYEFRFTFAVTEEKTEPRAEFKEEDVARVLVPFLFPRGKRATLKGCAVQRIDER